MRWKPYVPVAVRRAKAARALEKLAKKKNSRSAAPVAIAGRTIAHTFWGRAWCDNLERLTDFDNRLPRGRTYVRNGSVVDLHLAPGTIKAQVSGSSLYKVRIEVAPVPKALWAKICSDCTGAIDSLVELLQGRFSKAVMTRLCEAKPGLLPAPRDISLSCSCPDWAVLCKHVAAVLYGVGARLDIQPELLFTLRNVDSAALIAGAGRGVVLAKRAPASQRVLAGEGLAELFGLDLGASEGEGPPALPKRGKPRVPAASKARAAPKTPAASKARAAPKTRTAPKARATSKTRTPPKARVKIAVDGKPEGNLKTRAVAKGSVPGRKGAREH